MALGGGGQAPLTPSSPPKSPMGQGEAFCPRSWRTVMLTLGPTRPGAPASPGTPCSGGKKSQGSVLGAAGGPDPPFAAGGCLGGGKNRASPDLRVCRSLQGDLVAQAGPGRGKQQHQHGSSETPGDGGSGSPASITPTLAPQATPFRVLTWKPEGPGAPCSPLSPAGPCGKEDGDEGPQNLLGFGLHPPQDFGESWNHRGILQSPFPNATRARGPEAPSPAPPGWFFAQIQGGYSPQFPPPHFQWVLAPGE